MSRRLRLVITFAVAAASLAPAMSARADGVYPYRRHHSYYRSEAAIAARYAYAQAVIYEVANSPFYGPFGNYADAYAASQYVGPNERHYYGFGPGSGYFGYGPPY
jgi:hypothetical protein